MKVTPDPILESMRRDARAIFDAGLQAAAPQDAIARMCSVRHEQLHIGDRAYDLNAIRRIIVVGAGKATAAMAQAVERMLGDRISQGLIVVKYDHGAPLRYIHCTEAGHPIPDANGVDAARRILQMARAAGPGDLVLVLISGGGSALLALPAESLHLEEKQAVSQTLIACGASIHEINAIRKHISAIKGGRLARAAFPAALVCLILSDVVGDDLDVIASGPTVPDASTFELCMEIIRRYHVAASLPGSVMEHLKAGADGKIEETPKPDSNAWGHVHNLIVANNLQAIQSAAQQAADRGYQPIVLSSRIEGETRDVARVHAAIAREILASGLPISAPACILSGGETTVSIKGAGKGGRNQEFALSAALDIDRTARIVVLSGGTDGTDGPTDAAGAFADHQTIQRAAGAGLIARRHLDDNDAYPFFNQLGDLLKTGPTGTNVMDLRVFLVRAPENPGS
jgi:hydroxypyruvate reductase